MDIDLSKNLPEFIMLNKLGGAKTIYLEFKNLPISYASCNSVGHVIANCRCLDKRDLLALQRLQVFLPKVINLNQVLWLRSLWSILLLMKVDEVLDILGRINQ